MDAISLSVEDLDFVLPSELVAQRPAPERGASRLLVLEAGVGEPRAIGRFDELLLDQLREDDLVVANDARVLHARIPIRRVTGGAGELLLLAPAEEQPASAGDASRWVAMARPARKLRPLEAVGTALGAEQEVVPIERLGDQTWLVQLPIGLDDVPGWLAAHGELPLPPYITERDTDDERYQTVHARVDGSVAAPTAGLHFDDALWSAVRERCEVAHVTLHVGAGTFLPIAVDELDAHVMHHERYEIGAPADAAIRAARDAGRRIVAVGTTTTRTLEHAYRGGAAAELVGSTDLFITPGHDWSVVGALLTNFHLPRSTLIALVMAFHGIDETRAAYACAVREQLRFYSFGDAMFIHGPPARMTR
ncbi:MAG: S-adenosylmethionine/tRNA-ribosyltransferase-isomerase [Thermoleophilia bacterium]|nr:S-adenosylmethionine/tRNA-ribosyltransferase-isomerase [Thermoleophilia bacterium]